MTVPFPKVIFDENNLKPIVQFQDDYLTEKSIRDSVSLS